MQEQVNGQGGDFKFSKNKAISTKILDYIIQASIVLAYFAIPLFFTGMVAQGLGFEKMALFFFLVLVGLVAWVTKGVVLGELDIKRTPLDIPILVTNLIFLASTMLSVSRQDSLLGAYGSAGKGFMAVLLFSLFYYLVVNNIDFKKVKTLILFFIFSFFILAVYSLLQLQGIYILPMTFTHNPAFNPLGSISALTTFAVIVLPLLVALFSQLAKIFSQYSKPVLLALKIFLGILILADLLILIFLNGFVSWISALIGIVIILMFFLSKIIKVDSNNLLAPLLTFAVLIIFLVIGNFNFLSSDLPAEVGISRSLSWTIAKDALKENPFFGSGPSTFYYDFAKFKNTDFNSTPLWNVNFGQASGVGFELLATVGALGFLGFLILLLIAFSVSFLNLLKNKNAEQGGLLLGLFSGFVSSVLIAFSFSQNTSLIILSIVFAILMVALAINTYPDEFKTAKLSFRASPNFALALAALFLGVSASVVVLFTIGLKIYLADIYVERAVLANNNQSKIENLEKAVSLAPYRDIYYINLANSYMAEANKLAISGKDKDLIGQNLSKAIEYGREALRINPNKVENNEALALIYENASFYTKGALKWAKDLYTKASELSPNSPTPFLRLALINMAKANAETEPEEKQYFIKEAIKQYDKAIERKVDISSAYYGKAVAYEKLGEIDNAIDQLKLASLNSRDNIDYIFELGRLYFNKGVSSATLNQKASEKITEDKNQNPNDLSVSETANNQAIGQKNQYIQNAELLFLGVLQKNANHANALYSLGVLYKKVGENDKAKDAIQKLLKVLQDNNQKDLVKQQFADILK